jgi:hypothetical protein
MGKCLEGNGFGLFPSRWLDALRTSAQPPPVGQLLTDVLKAKRKYTRQVLTKFREFLVFEVLACALADAFVPVIFYVSCFLDYVSVFGNGLSSSYLQNFVKR